MVEEVNDADHLLEHAGEIVGIYAAAFGPEPELAADRFAAALAKHAERDGFRCCLAYMDSQPVGFIYGFTAFAGKPPSPWYARVRDVAGAEWIEGQFEVPWFGVRPSHQHRGMGSRLLDRILSKLPHRRAWLVTRAADERLRAFYRHRGWLDLAEDALGSETLRAVMGRDV
jgi:GNAT superfamily N-acetyltransferase